MKKYIKNPIYAGVVSEKWVETPYKAKLWNGLVSIDTFNKANRGKISLEIDANNVANIYYSRKVGLITRDRNNAMYPYKNYVLCPICKSHFKGSASTGKTGAKYPYYHCERNHTRYHVKKSDFEKTVETFLESVKFNKNFISDVRTVTRELYQAEKKKLSESVVDASNRASDLKSELALLMERIITSTSPVVRNALEKKYEEKNLEMSLALDERNRNEQSEFDLEYFERNLLNLMENPKELLKSGAKVVGLGNMFSRFFSETPTYEDLVSGNPKLTPIFELSRHQDLTKSQLVTPRGIEPRFTE